MEQTKTTAARKSTAKAAAAETTAAVTAKAEPKQFEPHDIVEVYNGHVGPLVYVSSKTGEVFNWEDYGEVQEMEIADLKAAKNTQKKFFTNNWFMFNDPDIPRFLGVEPYYRNSVPIGGWKKVFALPNDKLKKQIAAMTDGQKKTMAYHARRMIAEGEIDSIKAIDTLEGLLGFVLRER